MLSNRLVLVNGEVHDWRGVRMWGKCLWYGDVILCSLVPLLYEFGRSFLVGVSVIEVSN